MWRQANYGLHSSSSGILLISVRRDSLCQVFYEVQVFFKYSSVDGLLFKRRLFRDCSIQYSDFLIIDFLYYAQHYQGFLYIWYLVYS